MSDGTETLELAVGQRFRWSRTFTTDEVRAFSELSGDFGVHHTRPDGHGRFVVQGLLTASIVTKLGGDLNFLARTMVMQFRQPVYTGEQIDCTMTLVEVDRRDGRVGLRADVVMTNPDGEPVMEGSCSGAILTP